mmetsp:Transcript_37269/g.65068  ORF Transcript_37269/g.65068 Transcript_37269/m.65068 type:complete len:92 (-) Transcript_37269:70-345(-)
MIENKTFSKSPCRFWGTSNQKITLMYIFCCVFALIAPSIFAVSFTCKMQCSTGLHKIQMLPAACLPFSDQKDVDYVHCYNLADFSWLCDCK